MRHGTGGAWLVQRSVTFPGGHALSGTALGPRPWSADGVEITLDSVEPEPTLTADGAWWHPVAVTNRRLRVADAPLPLEHVLDVIRDVVAIQASAGTQGRSVFCCT